jgi:hypothetical protein
VLFKTLLHVARTLPVGRFKQTVIPSGTDISLNRQVHSFSAYDVIGKRAVKPAAMISVFVDDSLYFIEIPSHLIVEGSHRNTNRASNTKRRLI